MGVPMDEKYFTWLYEKVRPKGTTDLAQYTKVSVLAHRMIFDWSVPNDDNRAAEGKELRYEFEEELGIPKPRDTEWMGIDASIFEMMIALCRRCDFIADIGCPTWFDIFMRNLRLERFNDTLYRPSDDIRIERILWKFNHRQYRANGVGGLFPLRQPTFDQRNVELWYQMAAYMTENEMY